MDVPATLLAGALFTLFGYDLIRDSSRARLTAILLALIAAQGFVIAALPLSLAPQIARDLGTPGLAPSLFTAAAIAAVVTYAIAPLGDRVDRRWLVLASSALGGLCLLAVAHAHRPALLLAATGCVGACSLTPLVGPALVEASGPRGPLQLGLYLRWTPLATAASGAIALSVAQANGWRVALGAWALASFVLVAIAALLIPPDRAPKARRHEGGALAAARALARSWRDRGMAPVFGLYVCAGLLVASVGAALPLLFAAAGHGPRAFGRMRMTMALPPLLTPVWLGRLFERRRRRSGRSRRASPRARVRLAVAALWLLSGVACTGLALGVLGLAGTAVAWAGIQCGTSLVEATLWHLAVTNAGPDATSRAAAALGLVGLGGSVAGVLSGPRAFASRGAAGLAWICLPVALAGLWLTTRLAVPDE